MSGTIGARWYTNKPQAKTCRPPEGQGTARQRLGNWFETANPAVATPWLR
jgi:hypothetical protein